MSTANEWILLAALLAVSFVGSPAVAADGETATNQIVFLHLRMTNGLVILMDSQIVPGRLKARRGNSDRPQPFAYVVEGTDGQVLARQGLADPTQRRLEFELPESPGQLTNQIVATGGDFVLRLPYQRTVARVRFYDQRRPFGFTAKGVSTNGILLGTVAMPVQP